MLGDVAAVEPKALARDADGRVRIARLEGALGAVRVLSNA